MSLDATSTFVAFESSSNREYDDFEEEEEELEESPASPGDDVPISSSNRSFDEIVEEALQRDVVEEEEKRPTTKKYPFLRRGEGRSCLGSPSPVKAKHQQEQYPSRDKENETKTTKRFSRNILRKKSMRNKKKNKIVKKKTTKIESSPVDEEIEKFGALDEIVFGQGKQLLTFEYENKDESDNDNEEELAEFEALERRLHCQENVHSQDNHDMSYMTVKDLQSRLRDRAITTSQLFGFMDSDRSDRLTAKEIQNGLALARIHVDMSAVRSLMNEFDLDQDRAVSWSEFRDAFEDIQDKTFEDVEDKTFEDDKNEDEHTWGSLHHLSTAPPPQEKASVKEEEEMKGDTLECKSSLVRSYFPEENIEENNTAPKRDDENTIESVPKVLQDRLQQQLTRLDSEIVQYERERRSAAERKEQLKRAEDQLARDRAAFETWRQEQREMTEKWISEQQNKMKRRKAVLDRQAKAMYVFFSIFTDTHNHIIKQHYNTGTIMYPIVRKERRLRI